MTSKDLENRLKSLAFRIVIMTENLPKSKISDIIKLQILRSTFSAAANYRASCKAISKKSFVSKLSISFEEADETLFWVKCIFRFEIITRKKTNFDFERSFRT